MLHRLPFTAQPPPEADCYNISRIAMPAVQDFVTIGGFYDNSYGGDSVGVTARQQCATNLASSAWIDYRVRRAAGVGDVLPDY